MRPRVVAEWVQDTGCGFCALSEHKYVSDFLRYCMAKFRMTPTVCSTKDRVGGGGWQRRKDR